MFCINNGLCCFVVILFFLFEIGVLKSLVNFLFCFDIVSFFLFLYLILIIM